MSASSKLVAPPAPRTESSAGEVDRAVAAAHAAFPRTSRAPTQTRARLLGAIATALEDSEEELVASAVTETHLLPGRLHGELLRTAWQLRLFAGELATERNPRTARDLPDPSWPAGGRPDLRRAFRAIGPVLIFEAGNFPFAFGVAGTDTAAALAAGCPVVLKVHPGHQSTSQLMRRAIAPALDSADWPPGLVNLIHGRDAGSRALRDPRIQAAAFTGSTKGGRALFDIATSRPQPIPFYGELGSMNPVFVTPRALADRRDEILAGLVTSYTQSAGQLCTKPGIVVLPAGAGAEAEVADRARAIGAQHMLSDEAADGYASAIRIVADTAGVTLILSPSAGSAQQPALAAVSVAHFVAHHARLQTECFGPMTLLVMYDDVRELMDVAGALEGQLTATIHSQPGEPGIADLVWQLSGIAGRIIHNGWPTGVAVTPAQHHGGPYPASTSPLHTSVGTAAINRFLRPVTYQNMPDELLTQLPADIAAPAATR